jgi:hypothetical protein
MGRRSGDCRPLSLGARSRVGQESRLGGSAAAAPASCPAPAPSGPPAEAGLGLLIVTALADRVDTVLISVQEDAW